MQCLVRIAKLMFDITSSNASNRQYMLGKGLYQYMIDVLTWNHPMDHHPLDKRTFSLELDTFLNMLLTQLVKAED